jgi:hypothetical protein
MTLSNEAKVAAGHFCDAQRRSFSGMVGVSASQGTEGYMRRREFITLGGGALALAAAAHGQSGVPSSFSTEESCHG